MKEDRTKNNEEQTLTCIMNKLFGSKKSGENRSSELAQLEGSGKKYKHACQEAHKVFQLRSIHCFI
jgi:hypothetical protein